MAAVSLSVGKIYSQEQNTQPSELLTFEQAFGFDTEEQWRQATWHNKLQQSYN